jgi:hypothetical protein
MIWKMIEKRLVKKLEKENEQLQKKAETEN